MRKVYFTNARGESVLFDGSTPPILLSKLEGTGGVSTTIQMSKAPFQDGSTFIDAVLEPRYLDIEGAVWTTSKEEVMDRRQKLVRVLNPKLGLGRLRLDFGGVIREIGAIAESSPVFPDKGATPIQRFAVSFVCPDPAWYDPAAEQWTLASFTGGFSFPFSFPIEFGTVGQSIEIMNNGDLPSPILVTFYGPVSTPTLENLTTGEKISVVQEIPAGEKLEIYTGFGKKRVTRIDANGNQTNAFHWVSPDSVFWQMQPGLNEVSYAATGEAEGAKVTLEFYHRYAGV